MKTKIKYLLLLFTLLFVGCTDDDYPTFEVPAWEPVSESFSVQAPAWMSEVGTSADTAPDWFLNLKENDAVPDWTAPDPNLYPGSMTAIIRLTPYLEKYIANDDKMAAMIGDVCHGVAMPTNIDGVNYFFIQIKAASDEQGDVTLKYYSTSTNKLYTAAEKVPYRIDKIYGTSHSPVFPDFESSGKYPYYMHVVLQPNLQTVPFEVQQGDRLAAFAGNECRGSVTLNAENSTNKIFNMEIRGKEPGDPVVLKYYSHANERIYQLEEKFNIEHKAQRGTEATPVKFGVIPEAGIVAYVVIPDIFSAYTSNQDIVAAFVGDECRGVFSHRLSANGKMVYRIPAKTNSNEKISFRYYNSKLDYIFTTASNISVSSAEFGSATIPEVLPLITDGCHPLKMNAVLEMQHELIRNVSQNDLLAAFVNDECRGVGRFVEKNGKRMFEVAINGSLGLNEKVIIRYYNSSLKFKFESEKTIYFITDNSFGDIDNPAVIEMKVSSE